MEEPEDQPRGDDQRQGEDGGERGDEKEQEAPVAPGVAARRSEVAEEQLVVAAVGLPGDVEGVAEDGDGADEHADANVDGHAEEGDVGQPAHPAGDGDDERKQAGDDVAKAGYEADDAVDAEADAGAGDAEGFVEKDFKVEESVVAQEPRATLPACKLGGGEAGRVGGWAHAGRRRHCGLRRAISAAVRCYNRKGIWRL